MNGLVLVLLVSAAGLATAGAVVARDGVPDVGEARTRRAIVGLGLLAAAMACAALGGALLGSGGTGRAQVVAFGGAAAAVAVPLLAVWLARRVRRTGRMRSEVIR